MFLQISLLINILPFLMRSANTAIFPFYHKCYSVSLGDLRNYPFISQTTPFLQHATSEALGSFLMDVRYSYIYRYYLFQMYIPWRQGTIFIRSSYLFFDPHIVKLQDGCRGLYRKCPMQGYTPGGWAEMGTEVLEAMAFSVLHMCRSPVCPFISAAHV